MNWKNIELSSIVDSVKNKTYIRQIFTFEKKLLKVLLTFPFVLSIKLIIFNFPIINYSRLYILNLINIQNFFKKYINFF
jgi:hypothetical protein